MATRVPKTGAGGGVEFTQGTQPLHVAELDGDLDALFNGGITDSNVAPGAGIATSKLASDAGIIAAMLATNSVTTTKIADLNVTTGKLADLAVTTGKLAVGAAFNNKLGLGVIAGLNVGLTETAITALTPPLFTIRSTTVIIVGTLGASILQSTLSDTIILRLQRDTTNTFPAPTTIAVWRYTSQATSGNPRVPFPYTVAWLDTLGAGSYAYRLTAQTSVNQTLSTDGANPGEIFLIEFA